MRRREDHPIEKITLNLFKGEFEKLQLWYPKLGASKVVRELVHAYVRANEEKFNQVAQSTRIEIDLEEIEIQERKS